MGKELTAKDLPLTRRQSIQSFLSLVFLLYNDRRIFTTRNFYLTNTVVIQTKPAAWAVAMANVANSYKSSFISVFLPSFFGYASIISPGKVE